MMHATARWPIAVSLTLLAAAAPADAKHNAGLESVNQPVVSATEARVPSCPNWSSAGRDSASLTDSNFGCAINSNLAAMIADPLDLLHGRSEETTDTGTVTRAIKAWREMEPTSKQWTTTVKESAKSAGSGS